MNARRHFLSVAAAGTAAFAASPLMAQSAGPGSVLPTRGQASVKPLPGNPAQ
ncbi:aldo/keto reductase, partial [Mycobacterium tuberculosis]